MINQLMTCYDIAIANEMHIRYAKFKNYVKTRIQTIME